MKTVEVKRSVKFRVEFDETIPGARKFVMEQVREIMANRSMPIPFSVSGSHATYGSYRIVRYW